MDCKQHSILPANNNVVSAMRKGVIGVTDEEKRILNNRCYYVY